MRVLIVGAHPDDEILGAGGVWHKHQKNRDLVASMLMDDGRFDPKDQKFDTIPLVDLVKRVEDLIYSFKPHIVYTHCIGDINKDHQLTHEAVKIACRPTRANVQAVYGFDSTMSLFDNFNPTYFVSLTKADIDWKIKQMKVKYPEEMNVGYRKEKGIEVQSLYWGLKTNTKHAEAFEVIMQIQ